MLSACLTSFYSRTAVVFDLQTRQIEALTADTGEYDYSSVGIILVTVLDLVGVQFLGSFADCKSGNFCADCGVTVAPFAAVVTFVKVDQSRIQYKSCVFQAFIQRNGIA